VIGEVFSWTKSPGVIRKLFFGLLDEFRCRCSGHRIG